MELCWQIISQTVKHKIQFTYALTKKTIGYQKKKYDNQQEGKERQGHLFCFFSFISAKNRIFDISRPQSLTELERLNSKEPLLYKIKSLVCNLKFLLVK